MSFRRNTGRLRSCCGVLCLVSCLACPAIAQTVSVEHGFAFPVRGEFRVLVIFAEVDYSVAACPGSQPANPGWPAGELPGNLETYFDASLPATPGSLTDYFLQMSLGQYAVLGDHYPDVVTIDPTRGSPPYCGNPGVVDVLDSIRATGQPFETASGWDVDDLDLWTMHGATTGASQEKENVADDLIDLLLVVWRNYNPFLGRQCADGTCFSGSIGLRNHTTSGYGLETKGGFNNVGSFVSWSGGTGILVHEYLHGVFGGNNWHAGSGAGRHTFHAAQGSRSMFSSARSPSNIASGWDRNHLGWKAADRSHLIGALDQGLSEVPGDLDISTHPDGGVFVLRDFITTGDAIRIKLPHVDWTALGDTKNQYLWLQNHQRISSFDVNHPELDESFGSCHDKWTPGLHASIQVGKDTRDEDVDGDGVVTAGDIYPSDFSSAYPNALGSYLFPLSAEGRFDYFYRLDKADRKPGNCQFNNLSVPVEPALSLPNPFTGSSDLFFHTDSDNVPSGPVPDPTATPTFIPQGNGILHSGDQQHLLAECVGDVVRHSLQEWGDAEDSWSVANGKTEIALDTNPAAVPVYTHRSEAGFTSPAPKPAAGAPGWENRTIWLNGLSIAITAENVDGDGAIEVTIRWDDYRVDRDVRWTGSIVLQDDLDDPLLRQSRLIVGSGRTLYLDRGLSPTFDIANASDETVLLEGAAPVYPDGIPASETGRLFTDPTRLEIRAGSRLHLEENATLWVQNDSVLVVEDGAELILERGASIRRRSGGEAIIFGDTIAGAIFEDRSAAAGIADDAFRTVSAVFGNFSDDNRRPGHEQKTDLFVCNAGVEVNDESRNVWYRISPTTGVFTKSSFDGQSVGPFDSAKDTHVTSHALIYDFDNDHFDDVIVFNQSRIQVGGGAARNFHYRNLSADGGGPRFELLEGSGFTTKRSVTRGSAVYNIDGTGLADLLIANINTGNTSELEGLVRVYRNNAPADPTVFTEITDAIIDPASNSIARSIAVEDTDGDMVAEIWVNAGPTVRVLERSASDGKYRFNGLSFTGGGGFDMVDIDLDGRIDFTVGGRIYRNLGGLEFVEVVDVFHSDIEGLTSLRFFNADADNYPDLFLITTDGLGVVLKNVSQGGSISFVLADVLPGAGITGLAIGDVNGDNREDAYQCSVSPGVTNRYLQNVSSGTRFHVFTLEGGFESFGETYSSGPCIGGRVLLYEAGHVFDQQRLIATSTISLSQSDGISTSHLRAVFAFPDARSFDVVALFPSGRMRVLCSVPPGDFIVQERPDTRPRGVADASVRNDQTARANDNYGAQQFIVVGSNRQGQPDSMRALLRFDLDDVPAGALESAVLELTVFGYDGAGSDAVFPIQVHGVAADAGMPSWDEGNGYEGAGGPPGSTNPDDASGVAWTGSDANNQDQPAFEAGAVATSTIDRGFHVRGDVIRWDITELAQRWIDGVTPNHGLVLRDLTTRDEFAGVRFGSREGEVFDLPDAVRSPGLVLNYNVPARFIRGDCNGDGQVTGQVSDAVYLLNYNFVGGPRPPCLAACDVNGDGRVVGEVTDAAALLGFNFLGGPPPRPPFPDCGISTRETDLEIGCKLPPEVCR